ncbi:receptor-like protein kinase FERONIA [Tanacetum coccineum]
MLTLPLFCLLLIFTTTTSAQAYKATDHFLLNCGSSTTSTFDSNQTWAGDEHSKFVPSDITATSFSSKITFQDPSVPTVPYSTARIINTSSFTYTFPVSEGPKFLRLYFYPATYSGLTPNHSFFSVSSNGYTLLTNFSAFLTASFLAKTHFVKEFLIYVKDTQLLYLIFTPLHNSYAFINGIEIVSMPDNLYFNAKNPKPIGISTGPVINKDTALETVYRLNVGGAQISGINDTGMYRSWDQDSMYLYGAETGLTPVDTTPITYTIDTPSYTAPEAVYQTQRSMGNQSDQYNLTWILPVDSGFYYMLRLHFCSIIPQYSYLEMIFRIFINNQTAEDEADIIHWARGSRIPIYKDYVVFVNNPSDHRSKQDLWLQMHPNEESKEYLDAYLNGLEVFKVNMDPDLSSPTPNVIIENNKKTPPSALIISGVGGGLVLLSVLLLIVFYQRRRTKHHTTTNNKPLPPSDSCRRFSLKEVKVSTNKFSENYVIGNGGFGKVYKGYMGNAKTTVAIKRLNPSSTQGFHEFQTEIQMLSRLRHENLVSLIGYCDENGEMMLVYDYMARGNLREHLYKTNNPPLSWKTRLNICIGAAKGLHYIHTSEKNTIIHRDVKCTNILLDENWVAKVSDFGLSKLGSKDPSQTHVTTMVKGSIGYIDPEYCKSQHLREKSDVYSFGVVLFEVLCARPVIIPWLTSEQVILADWGKTCYQRGTLVEIIDQNLSGQVAPECLRKFGEVANSCLHEEGCERPTMDVVVQGLEVALQLQEAFEEMGGIVGEDMLENQEPPFVMQVELTAGKDHGIEDREIVAHQGGNS